MDKSTDAGSNISSNCIYSGNRNFAVHQPAKAWHILSRIQPHNIDVKNNQKYTMHPGIWIHKFRITSLACRSPVPKKYICKNPKNSIGLNQSSPQS